MSVWLSWLFPSDCFTDTLICSCACPVAQILGTVALHVGDGISKCITASSVGCHAAALAATAAASEAAA